VDRFIGKSPVNLIEEVITMSHTQYQAVMSAPFGGIAISMRGEKLCGIDYLSQAMPSQGSESAALSRVRDQIEHYLRTPFDGFSLELDLRGTEFQRKVWRRLMVIKPGCTTRYGELADELSTSARAVGNACRQNPCPLVIPCHRVVAKNGLGGFSGKRSGPKLEIKRWLLKHEGWL
jgi:methylated-DNA-[protein]-cysteine S-methyltransferase